MALLTANHTYKLCGVTVNEKIIPDGTRWQDAAKAQKEGFAANALYKKQVKLTRGTGKACSVTIHNTDDLPRVEDDGEQYVRATYNENMKTTRVHFYVDDICAWQELKAGTGMCSADPVGSAEVSWHAGDGSIADGGNMTSISIEVIMNDAADHDAKTYDNSARLAAWMLWRHKLTVENLFSHTYWVNKSAGKIFDDVDEQCTTIVPGKKWCPTYIFKSSNHATALANWKTYKALVGRYLDALNGRPTQEETQQEQNTVTYTKGSSNEQTVYNFLTSVLSLNMAGTCGVLANIQCESAFKPDALGDNGTSYGICQWHAGRYTALKTWCASNGKDYKTLDGQLWYLKYELERSYTSVLTYINAVENTGDGAYNAGHRWCAKFEIPANTEVNAQKRGELAKGTYWTKYNRTSANSDMTTGTPGNVAKNDLVQLSADAKYYSGATMPGWVKNQNWYVISVVGDRAILGKSESGKNNINSSVNTKYLNALNPTGSAQSAYTPAAVGDLVYYNGNVHYTAADALTAKPCVGGQARITRIYKLGKSKHPYSLVRVAGKGATVWGWVDEGTFTKV